MPFFRFLSDFKLIFIEFLLIFLIKIAKKGGFFYSTDPADDVARTLTWRGADVARGTSADATWHWGHVAGPRMAHARRRWRGHVAGGHAGPCGRPCGTMFPHVSNEQLTWWLHRRWILSRGIDRVDPSPRDRNHSTCVKATLSDRDQKAHRSPCGITRSTRSSSNEMQRDRDQTATMKSDRSSPWRHVDISRQSDSHRTGERHGSMKHDCGRIRSARSSSEGSRWRRAWTTSWATMPTISRDRTAGEIRGRVHAIAARSHRDRGSITPRSRLDWITIVVHLERSWHTITSRLVAHDRRAIMATNQHPIADQTAWIFFGQKSSLKTDVLPHIL